MTCEHRHLEWVYCGPGKPAGYWRCVHCKAVDLHILEDWEEFDAVCDRQEKAEFRRNIWTVVGLILLFLGLCVLWALIVNDRLIHLFYLCRP